MPERFLTVDAAAAAGTAKKKGMLKTFSFTTDDDDANGSPPAVNSTEPLQNDQVSQPESERSDVNVVVRKRKSRRQGESLKPRERRRSSHIEHDSRQSSRRSILLKYIIIAVLIYLTWVNRNAWITRLTSTRTQLRHWAADPSHEAETIALPVDSGEDTSHVEEATEKKPKRSKEVVDIVAEKTDQAERQEKKRKLSKDEVDVVPAKIDRAEHREKKSRKDEVSVNREHSTKKSDTASDRKTREHRSEKTDSKVSKRPSNSSSSSNTQLDCYYARNATTGLSNYQQIIEVIRRNLTTRGGDRDLIYRLLRKTGWDKTRFSQFLDRKNDQSITFPTFVSLLDVFDLKMLIAHK